MLSARRAWKEEAVFHEGEDFFRALLQALASARKSVDLETYAFNRDAVGLEVISELREAAGRGVTVRLLLDGLGCSRWTFADLKALRSDGVQVRCFHPLPWQQGRLLWLQSTRLKKWITDLWKLKRRNLRKTCIVDGEVAFAGGITRLKGPGIYQLMLAFENAWRRGQRGKINEELVERIAGAQGRVWISNPSFAPGPSSIRALRYAAGAGVDVRLLMPKRVAFCPALLMSGVRIYESPPAGLHPQTALIDEWASVGSEIVLRKVTSLSALEMNFVDDLLVSKEIVLNDWGRRGLFEKFFEGIALIFRRWI